jgi:hypothetical protein
MLEVAGSAVFLGEEGFACVELPRFAFRAFGRIGAVEVGNMIVSNVPEPRKNKGQL